MERRDMYGVEKVELGFMDEGLLFMLKQPRPLPN